MQRIFHTPEGVRDIYNGECSQKRKVQEKIHRVFHQYGYEDIETPTFEYFEVFSREVGTIPPKNSTNSLTEKATPWYSDLTSPRLYPEPAQPTFPRTKNL